MFVSKLLGLLYYSPLSSTAGESNMMFYSIVYAYYETFLTISSAGIPFAIAALVAKYIAKEDFKTTILVKKMGTSITMILSFVVAFGFILISTPLARQSLGSSAPQEDIQNLKEVWSNLNIIWSKIDILKDTPFAAVQPDKIKNALGILNFIFFFII